MSPNGIDEIHEQRYYEAVGVSLLALPNYRFFEMVPIPPSFQFNNGTTQNWTIDQLYGWKKGPNYNTNPNDLTGPHKLDPFKPPIDYTPWSGFNLGNYNNQALSASVYPLAILDPDVVKCSFLFVSPYIGNSADWSNAKGYSADITRKFFSKHMAMDNLPNLVIYSAQLEAWLIIKDLSSGQPKTNPETKDPYFLLAQAVDYKPIDIPIGYGTKQTLTFKMTDNDLQHLGFQNCSFQLIQLKVRCTMLGYPGDKQLEYCAGGSWLLSNVSPQL